MAITDWTDMSSPEDLVGLVSTNSDGLFGMVVWGLAWIVLFFGFMAAAQKAGSSEPAKDGLLGSAVVMSFASYFMGVMEWISIYFTVVPTVVTVIALIILALKN